jgi:hypothetical protein
MAGFLGMRGTGDWATDQRPKNWRDGLLFLYPNGMAPLTALTAKMASEKVDDPEYNWWLKTLPAQAGDVTGVYTDPGLSSAYVTGAAALSTLYLKMSEADASHFRAGHQVVCRDQSDYDVDCVAKITDVVKNGASSYVAVKLLEADDNSTTHDLSDCDRVLIIGNINPESGSMPDAISYDPVKYTNYTQIFRNALSISRTARLTKLRTGDAYTEAKREALELHSIEMEKAFMWGIPTENTGANGKPERTTGGLIYTIKTYASGNVSDYSLSTDFQGKTWLEGGEDWLDYFCSQVFRYGGKEKLAYCGQGALLGIQRLIKANPQVQMALTPKTIGYGISVTQWITVFGTINLVTHPLFSYELTNYRSVVIFEPSRLKYRFLTDTTFYKDGEQQNTGYARIDGTNEEFLTECGLEYHFPQGFGYLNGVGSDNELAAP